jgi:hypothetical protein
MSQSFTTSEYEDFLRARMTFWKTEARKVDPTLAVAPTSEVELEENSSHFAVSCAGPAEIVAILEDSDEVGWLYLYEPLGQRRLRCSHVYNRQCANVEADDIDVVWSMDHQTCGVAIWGQFYVFLGISNGVRMRKRIQDKDSDGFYFQEWPDGFQHFLAEEENAD